MCLRTATKDGMGAFPGGSKWEWCEVVGEASPKEANGGQWFAAPLPDVNLAHIHANNKKNMIDGWITARGCAAASRVTEPHRQVS